MDRGLGRGGPTLACSWRLLSLGGRTDADRPTGDRSALAPVSTGPSSAQRKTGKEDGKERVAQLDLDEDCANARPPFG